MGRPKKPAEQHRKNGTYRPDRHSAAPLAIAIPDMPPALPPFAQAVWKNVTQQLFHAGLVSEIDQTALRLLTESCWLYAEAHDDIVAKGLTIETTNGNVVQNPSVGIRNKAWTQIAKMLQQFGMTPSSRTGLGAGAMQDDDDADNAILGFKVG